MMKPIALSFIALFLAAPNMALAGDGAFWGTTLGATTGGLVGSTIGKGAGNLAATGAGVFIGGAIGNSVGRSLDRANRPVTTSPRAYNYDPYRPSFGNYQPTYVAPPAPRPRTIYVQEPQQIIQFNRAPQRSLSTGSYAGPPSGSKPANHQGRHCREFTQNIKIDGQMRESYGTACLRPDGSWQIVQ